YCTHYHRAAALASGATEQEIAEAAVWLDTCATGRRCSMGPAPTSKPTRRWSTESSPASDAARGAPRPAKGSVPIHSPGMWTLHGLRRGRTCTRSRKPMS
ncbi:MAG: carboxymuconolactone decarboxylase family protein, partial [Rhodovulum sp.]|nr:carboxymuconolactone decarboxylase family protein [Rhodovulum sp.]